MLYDPRHDDELREPHINCKRCLRRIPEAESRQMGEFGYCLDCLDFMCKEVRDMLGAIRARIEKGRTP